MFVPARSSRPADDPLVLLRARIARLERAVPDGADRPAVLALGLAELDAALPEGGLRRGALHEVAALDGGAGAAFATWLLRRLMGSRGTALWCQSSHLAAEQGLLYGPALATVGPAPERLILARARNDRQVLWAMEEGTRPGVLAAVVGEVATLGLTASRRLQLAAEKSATAVIALRPPAARLAPAAAVTRWRVAAASTRQRAGQRGSGKCGLGPARWRVELWRVRGGTPKSWILEWCHETGDLAVAAEAADRPLASEGRAAAPARRRAG